MPKSRLGLFDTPPGRQESRLGLLLVALLFAALVILSALPAARARQINAFIPIVDSVMFFGDALTATLLYAQASIFRSRALTVLASGYLFGSLILIGHLLTFPGAFAPDGLLGAGLSTTAWIANVWRAAPPTATLLYVLVRRTESAEWPFSERPPAPIAVGVLAATILAVGTMVVATRGHDLLPQLFLNRSDLHPGNNLRINLAEIALLILAMAALFPRRKSVLDLWLLVALSGWLAHALLNIQATGRFTFSFYTQFGMLLFLSNFCA